MSDIKQLFHVVKLIGSPYVRYYDRSNEFFIDIYKFIKKNKVVLL